MVWLSIRSFVCILGTVLVLPYGVMGAAQTQSSGTSSSARSKRAIGGESFSRGTWPWLALLRATITNRRLFGFIPMGHYHLYCGGVIISDRWILTAAHCFTENGQGASDKNNWEARLGTIRLRPSIRQRILDVVGRVISERRLRNYEVDFDRIVVHPNYNTSALYSDDIALVRLEDPVPGQFSLISHVTLPNRADDAFPAVGDVCVTKGWGCTSSGGGPSRFAHQIEMPIYPNSRCSGHYMATMNNRLCAGYRNRNIGVCRGDSGSPLVCKRGNDYILTGIVSFTSRYRPESFPAVFTKVKSYIPWIEQVTGLNLSHH